MIDRAKKLVDLALKNGAIEAEIYSSKGRVVLVETQQGDLGFAEESITEGIGVRVIANGATGYSSSNDPAKFNDAVLAAIETAKARGPDKYLKGLPKPKPYRTVRGIYDKRIEDMTLDGSMDIAATMVEEAKKVPGINVTFGRFSSVCSETAIVNSNGISIADKETVAVGYIDVILKKNDQVSTAYDYEVSRDMDVNFAMAGAKASDLAVKSLGGVALESQTTDILLGPHAFADILEATLISSINAETVQKGRSGLAGKIGQRIATDGFTMIDDGLLEKGLGTSQSDDEGVPSQRTPVIEDGILKSFLYDYYTASKEGRESTGNGIRGSYSMSPKVGVRNIRFEYPRCDIVRETDKGIFVNSIIGAHTANPISGEFSVECRNAFIVKDGVLEKPVKSMMIAGNVFDLLNKVDGMSREEKFVGPIVAPTVKVLEVKVTPGA